MKILHVYKDFCPPVFGGMERHIGLMCRFQRQWAEVEALTCSRSWRSRVVDRDGTRVTEVGELGRFQGAPVSPGFPVRLRWRVADVVVIHVPNPTAVVAWLAVRHRGVLVVRYHSDIVRQAAALRFYAPIQMNFLRKAAMIVATSEQYVNTSPVLGPVRDRTRVIPLGILPEEFARPNAGRVQSLRERYGGGYVLFAGRHRYYKGLENLVKAANEIRAPVVIAGDGPERERCMALARETRAEIAFPGSLSQEDLVDHLHGCDVVAFPSTERSEAFGISILEAHACGKPVVATKLGTGVEFANLDGQTGLNVAPGDPGALAETVNALLGDPDRRAAFGGFAKRRVETEFHAEQVARAEYDLYEEVMNAGS